MPPLDPPQAVRVLDALLRARRTRKILDGARLGPDEPRGAARAAFDAALRSAIAAAGQAPFHFARDARVPEPWRFTVLDRDALDALARELPQCLPGKLPHIVKSAGALVQATFRAETDPALAARDAEHHSAAAAAVMALLLGCEARGLGSYWCTASPLAAPEMRAWCGLDAEERWLGALFVGHPLAPEREAAEGIGGRLRAQRSPPEGGWLRWLAAR